MQLALHVLQQVVLLSIPWFRGTPKCFGQATTAALRAASSKAKTKDFIGISPPTSKLSPRMFVFPSTRLNSWQADPCHHCMPIPQHSAEEWS